MAATVTSIREPACEYGGSVAVTITAAVFFTWMAVADTVSPMRSSRLVRLWAENTVCTRSPVPARPTTSP